MDTATDRPPADKPWVCPWDICNAEQAQECRAAKPRNTMRTRGCNVYFPPDTTPEQAKRMIQGRK